MILKQLSVLIALGMLVACGNKQEPKKDNPTVMTESGDQSKEINTPANTQTENTKPYNVTDKANGIYSRIPGESYQSDWGPIPEKVKVQVIGKKISIDGDKYRFEKLYKNKDTLLTFGEVSEESGDFLGGGEIIISGDKVTYRMFYGTEASEVFVFRKN